MDNSSSYNNLKSAVLQHDYSPDVVELVKEFYANEIDSLRRTGCIKSMEDLLDCLERRDVLSEYNIDPLRRIVPTGDQRLQQAIELYDMKKPSLPKQLVNEYEQERLGEELQQRLHLMEISTKKPMNHATVPSSASSPGQCLSSLQFQNQFTDKKRAEIAKLLSTDIGKSWRSFGRELEICEGTMDDIELKHPRDLPSCVHRLLMLVEDDASRDPRQHVLLLCRALEGCGRKDLRRKIENIMTYA